MSASVPSIERVTSIDAERFFNTYVKRGTPVVITDLQQGWKASEIWSTPYFRSAFGTCQVGTMALRSAVCDAETYSERAAAKTSLSMVLDDVEAGNLDGKVVACPTALLGPALAAQFKVPFNCDAKRFFRSRIYIGPAGTVTPLHHDLPENLYAVVRGRKRITLFHPDDSKFLYRNPFWSRLPNFSQVNPEAPDLDAFPKYGRARPLVIDLKAGETLYIPSFWWHHLRNMETSIAMSFWWPEGWRQPVAWAAARYKALTTSDGH
jgi:hypothetical protein